MAAGTAAGGVSGHVHHAAPAPAPAAPAYTAPSSTLVITKAPPPTMMTLEESMDESLVTVISPKASSVPQIRHQRSTQRLSSRAAARPRSYSPGRDRAKACCLSMRAGYTAVIQ